MNREFCLCGRYMSLFLAWELAVVQQYLGMVSATVLSPGGGEVAAELAAEIFHAE